MKKFLSAILIIPLLMWSAALDVRAAKRVPDGATIAVLPFHNDAGEVEGLSFGDAAALSKISEVFLSDVDRFNVMENQERSWIMSEQAYNNQMTTDQQYRTNFGRMLGARYLIAGTVTGAGLKPNGARVESGVIGAKGGSTKYTVEVQVAVKLIDVETGALVRGAFGSGKSSSAKAEFELTRPIKSTSTSNEDGDEYSETQIDRHDVIIKISAGADKVSNIQFINAAKKAVEDALFNEAEGLLAKLDGTNKRIRR